MSKKIQACKPLKYKFPVPNASINELAQIAAFHFGWRWVSGENQTPLYLNACYHGKDSVALFFYLDSKTISIGLRKEKGTSIKSCKDLLATLKSEGKDSLEGSEKLGGGTISYDDAKFNSDLFNELIQHLKNAIH